MKWLFQAALLSAMGISIGTQACEPLALSGHLQGHFDASGQRCFTLPTVSENYVDATLSGATDAELRHAHQPWRTLVNRGPADGSHALLFALPLATPSTLILTGEANHPWTLRWTIHAATPLNREQRPAPVSPTLQRLDAHLAAGGSTDAFWHAMAAGGTPLVEPYSPTHRRVTFLWRGTPRNVFLFGTPDGERASLYRLADSDVWFRSYVVPADTLMHYKLAPDVPAIAGSPLARHRAILVSAQADPLNPHRAKPETRDRWDSPSLLDLSAQRHCTLAMMRRSLSHGALTRHTFVSDRLGNRRDIQVYRPHQPTPWTLMLFDGNIYQQDYRIANVVDGLIARGALPPVNLVLIDSLDLTRRARELTPNPAFADVMAQTLRPWLQAQGLPLPASRTILAGSSYGGLAAAWVAMRYPQHFGNVLSLSGSFWWAPKGDAASWLTREYQRAPRLPVRFWLHAGEFETDGPDSGILLNNREFAQVLDAKGYRVSVHSSASGHDYAGWCEALVTGLNALTGHRAGQ